MVYEVGSGREIGLANGSTELQVELDPGRLAIFAVLPRPIGQLRLSLEKTANPSGTPTVTVELQDAGGNLIAAAVPLEIKFVSAHSGNELRPPIYQIGRAHV